MHAIILVAMVVNALFLGETLGSARTLGGPGVLLDVHLAHSA